MVGAPGFWQRHPIQIDLCLDRGGVGAIIKVHVSNSGCQARLWSFAAKNASEIALSQSCQGWADRITSVAWVPRFGPAQEGFPR